MSDEEYTNGERVGQVLTHGLNSDEFMNKIGISLRGRRWSLHIKQPESPSDLGTGTRQIKTGRGVKILGGDGR